MNKDFQSLHLVSTEKKQFDIQLKEKNYIYFITEGSGQIQLGSKRIYIFPNRMVHFSGPEKIEIILAAKSKLIEISFSYDFFSFTKNLSCFNLSCFSEQILLYLTSKKVSTLTSQLANNLLTLALRESQMDEDFFIVIPMPQDPRVKAAISLVQDSSNDESLQQICQKAGASKRTVERIFQAETGMTFAKWRQLIRIQKALIYIDKGLNLNEIAIEVGYRSGTTLAQSFREVFGVSPQKYLKIRKQNKTL